MKEVQRGSHKLSLLSSPSPLNTNNYSNSRYGSASEDAESIREEILFGDEVMPEDHTINQDSPEAAAASSYRSIRDWIGHGEYLHAPRNNNMSRRRSRSASVRESLLAEAWERKRETMMIQKKWEESSMGEDEEEEQEEEAPEGIELGSEGAAPEVRQEGGTYVDDRVAGVVRRRRGRSGRRGRPPAGSTARSLTDDDFEELRGCIDLGFSFDERSLPDLSDTLPALEVYCAVSRSLHNSPGRGSSSPVSPSSPSWRVASKGDEPEEIKDRLRRWAQAVACNVKLCQ